MLIDKYFDIGLKNTLKLKHNISMIWLREEFIPKHPSIIFQILNKITDNVLLNDQLVVTLKDCNHYIETMSSRLFKSNFKEFLMTMNNNKMTASLSTGFWNHVLPEFQISSQLVNDSMFQHIRQTILVALKNNYDYRVVLVALLHDLGKIDYMLNRSSTLKGHSITSIELSKIFLNKFEYSKTFSDEILFLIRNHMCFDEEYFKEDIELVKDFVNNIHLIDHVINFTICDSINNQDTSRRIRHALTYLLKNKVWTL